MPDYFDSQITVPNGTIVTGKEISGLLTMRVMSGGVANSTTIGLGGRVTVNVGGQANHTVMEAGTMIVSVGTADGPWGSPGEANWTTVKGGSMRLDGGKANNTVLSGGVMTNNSGTQNITDVHTGASLELLNHGYAVSTTVHASGNLVVSGTGTIARQTLVSGEGWEVTDGRIWRWTSRGGTLMLMDGGRAELTTVDGGEVRISSGGVADGMTMDNALLLVGSGGTAQDVTFHESAQFEVWDGGVLSNATVLSACGGYLSGGTARDLRVGSSSWLQVSSGGLVEGLTVDKTDQAYIWSGATVDGGTITNNGRLRVHGSASAVHVEQGILDLYGVAEDITVSRSGDLYVYAVPDGNAVTLLGSNTIAGQVYFIDDGRLNAAGATVSLDLTQRSMAFNRYFIDGLSKITGAAYTITVSAEQEAGAYVLATGAQGFAGSITVNGAGQSTYGTVSVGETLTANDTGYTLLLDDDGVLSLRVQAAAEVPRPDLAVQTLRVLKEGQAVTTVAASDQLTVHIGLCNQGLVAANASTLKVYCGEMLLKEIAVAAIEAGGTATCTCVIEAGSMSTGVQELRVVADARGSLDEADESNNEARLALLVENRELCDLVVGAIALDQEACTPAEAATVRFTIKNIGYAAAVATQARVYAGDTLLGTVAVPALAAGAASEELSYVIPAGTLAIGTHAIRVVADGDGQAVESDTGNNAATVALTIGGPDLSISRLTLSKNTCTTGDRILLAVTIRNGGISDAAASQVAIYDGDTLLGTIAVDSLEAGLSVIKTFTIAAGKLAAGAHTLTAVADAGNAVTEADETNNTRTAALLVTEADTQAPSFTGISIAQSGDGYDFTVTASASDNLTAANRLQYQLRVASSQKALATAAAQDALSFALAPGNAGETWYYQVAATDEAGNTAWSSAKAFTVADHTAPVFGAVQVTTADMTLGLTWSASDNVQVTTYKVYFDDVLKSTQTDTGFVLRDVGTGTHTYRIEAFDAAGNAATTGNVNVRFDDTEAPVLTALSIAQAPDSYAFTVSAAATDNLTAAADQAFQLQYAFRADAVAAADASGLAFELTPADASKMLYYRVAVQDEAGNTAWSEVQTVVVKDVTAPGVVSGLEESVNGTGVTLAWGAGTDNVGVAGYRLRYGTTTSLTGEGEALTSNRHTLLGLDAGQYHWQVAAVDAAGNLGEWSAPSAFMIFPADPYESNNTAETAYNLGTLHGEKSWAGGAVAAAEDADWFRFTLDSKGTANDYLQIDFTNPDGDLDLYLYAVNGTTLVAAAKGTTIGTERISLNGCAKGTYLAKVVGKDGAMNPYTLTARKTTGFEPDRYDANTPNDTIAAATVIDVENTPKGTVANLNLHEAGDTDFYSFTLSNLGVADDTVSISFANAAGDLDLYLYDGTGALVQKSAGTGDQETLSFTGLAAGTYFVQVKAPYNALNEYTLAWNFTPNAVAADAFEGHEPIALENGTSLTGLTISPDAPGTTRQDAFSFTLKAPGAASSKVLFSGYRADWNGLQYTITDTTGQTVRSGVAAEVSLEGLAAGDYTLVVDAPLAGSYSAYNVTATLPEGGEEPQNGWGIFIYINGDNNLEKYYLREVVNMQKAILQDGVEVYLLLDRSSDASYHVANNTYGKWSDTRVGKLVYNSGSTITIDWMSWGEQNTGDINVLGRFLDWGMEQCEAKNYAVIVQDHGNSNGNISYDYTDGTHMSIRDVAGLLSQYENVSVTGFNACMMGSEDVLAALTGKTEYVVASEATGWTGMLDYKSFLTNVSATNTARDVASQLVDSLQAESYAARGYDTTFGAFYTADSTFMDALDAFGAASSEFSDSDWDKVATGFRKANDYGSCYSNVSFHYSDLLIILDGIQGGSPILTRAVNTLKAELNERIIVNYKSCDAKFGQGLSIFNPLISAADGHKYYRPDERLPHWKSFIDNLSLNYHDADFAGAMTGVASMGALNENSDMVSAYDLGCFGGAGIRLDSIWIEDSLYFTLDLLQNGKAGEAIVVQSQLAETPIALTLLDEDMNTVTSGNGWISLEGVGGSETGTCYYLKACPAHEALCTLAFEADWLSGMDRYDYVRGQGGSSLADGNGSFDKAKNITTGYYSGLVTYSGDSDWYQIGNPYMDEYSIVVSGNGLTVAEYDISGTMIQTAVENHGQYSLMVKSNHYLYIQGDAELGADAVNPYTISIGSVGGNAVGPVEDDWEDLATQGPEGAVGQFGRIAAGAKYTDEVGKDDPVDYLAFTLQDAAALSFALSSENAAQFSIYQLNSKAGRNGVVAYSLKSLQSTKVKAGAETVSKKLLLQAGTYYLGMASTNKKASDAAYSITVEPGTVFFTQGDNSDDWGDLKAKGAAGAVGDAGTLTAETTAVVADWAGYGDAIDYQAFTVESGASLAFDVASTDAVKFTVWSLSGTEGKYKLKSVGNVTPKLDKATGQYTASTKALLLNPGTYYLSVEAKNAKKGGSADYTVSLNAKSAFFTEGDNSDDAWDNAPALAAGGEWSDWVGFGDAIDYRTITIDDKGGFYSFNLSGVENGVKMTVFSVVNGKLKKLKNVAATAKKPSVSTGALALAGGGTYVLAVEATGAKKAQNSHYTVSVEEQGVFSGTDNNSWATATALDGDFAGCLGKGGDTVDYFDLSSWKDGLSLEMESGSVKASFYDANQKAVKLAAVEYANGTSKAGVASLTLKDGDKLTDVIRMAAVDESVKYLKIEAAGTGRNSYRLGMLA